MRARSLVPQREPNLQPKPANVDSGSEETPKLGVLLVHGIGEQLQGETLIHYGDAIACWLTRWLSRGAEVDPGSASGVSVRKTELEPGDESSARVTLTLNGEVPREWILAESWWAETFRAAKVRPLLMWLLTILPYMLAEQFFAPFRRAQILRRNAELETASVSRRVAVVGRYVTSALLLAAVLPLAGLGLLVVLLLLVPMVIPIERVRDMAKKVALKLANTLGDSFVLTSSPLQFDAMTVRVARDLQNLAKDVDEIAIVAHSQGTAVAYAAIERYGAPEGLRLFVTAGQALEKLAAVREFRKTPRRFRYLWAWLGVLCFFALGIAAARAAVLLVEHVARAHRVEFMIEYGIAAAALVGLIAATLELLRVLRCGRTWAPSAIEPPAAAGNESGPVKWINYYASADPVSNGPLFEKDRPDWMTEVEVSNHASVLSDHTSYAVCEDGFMALLALELLDQQKRTTEPLGAWRDEIEEAMKRRWWRVWWLATSRILALAGAVAGAISITARKHFDDVGGIASAFKDGVHYLSLPLRSTLGISEKVMSDATLAGITLVALVVLAGYLGLVALWKHWEAGDLRVFFSRGHVIPAPLGGFRFGLFVTALTLVTTLAGFVIAYGNYPMSGHDLVYHWLWALIPPLAAAVVVTLLVRSEAAEEPAPEVPAAVPGT